MLSTRLDARHIQTTSLKKRDLGPSSHHPLFLTRVTDFIAFFKKKKKDLFLLGFTKKNKWDVWSHEGNPQRVLPFGARDRIT